MALFMRVSVESALLASAVDHHIGASLCPRRVSPSPQAYSPTASTAVVYNSRNETHRRCRPSINARSPSSRSSPRLSSASSTSSSLSTSAFLNKRSVRVQTHARQDSQAPGDPYSGSREFDTSGEIAREIRDEKLAHGQDAFVSDAECWEAGWYGVNTNWWDELKTYDNKDEVFILLFGVGTGQEGVYSLQRISKDGLPLDTVLAFATQRDAEKYAALLENEMAQQAHVETILPSELMEFCAESGFEVRVVDYSAVLLGIFCPPKQSVEVTDWERAVRLRAGLWSMCNEPFEGKQVEAETLSGAVLRHSEEDMDNMRRHLQRMYDEM